MTNPTEKEALYQSVQYVALAHPGTFAPWMSAVVRRVAISMPEEYWEEFKTSGTEPCGTPECNCHHQTKLLVMLMDVHRKKGKEGGFSE